MKIIIKLIFGASLLLALTYARSTGLNLNEFNEKLNELERSRSHLVENMSRVSKGLEIYNDKKSKNLQIQSQEKEFVDIFLASKIYLIENIILNDVAKTTNTIRSETPSHALPVMNEYLQDYIDINLSSLRKLRVNLNENDQYLYNGKITVLEHSVTQERIVEKNSLEYKDNIKNIIKEFQDAKNNQLPFETRKLRNQREMAKRDLVSQVLNYSSGVPEDASGDSFFYPADTDNGQCVYKIAIRNPEIGGVVNGLAQADKIMSAQGVQGGGQTASLLNDGIDLNKANFKSISYHELRGIVRNKYTGVTPTLRYQTRIEGLPDIFECDSNSCNIDRLKRGWSLVASKCKGTKKAF